MAAPQQYYPLDPKTGKSTAGVKPTDTESKEDRNPTDPADADKVVKKFKDAADFQRAVAGALSLATTKAAVGALSEHPIAYPKVFACQYFAAAMQALDAVADKFPEDVEKILQLKTSIIADMVSATTRGTCEEVRPKSESERHAENEPDATGYPLLLRQAFENADEPLSDLGDRPCCCSTRACAARRAGSRGSPCAT